MIIDEKGRLFKKINLLDLLIVLMLIGIGVVVVYKMNNSKVISPFAQKDKIETVLYFDEVLDEVVESITVGDVVRDKNTDAVLGTVTKVEVGPSVNYAYNDAGQYVKTSKEGFKSLHVTVVGTGVYSDTRVVFDNNDFFINKTLEYKVGNTILSGKPKRMTKIEE